MALNLGTLFFRMGADTRGLEKATRKVKSQTKQMERDVRRTTGSVKGLSRAFGFLGTALTLTAGVAIVKTADNYNLLQKRIRLATKETDDYMQVSNELNRIAKSTGTELGTNVGLFQALARSAKELGATNTDVLKLAQTVNQLGVMSGATTADMANGMRQFTQSMSGGVVRAEEFNSIIENMPELANRIGMGLGKTNGELRQMMLDGKLLSKDVFNVLLEQSEDINKEFKGMGGSVQQSAQKLKTTFIQFSGEVLASSGALDTLQISLDKTAAAMDRVDTAALGQGLNSIFTKSLLDIITGEDSTEAIKKQYEKYKNEAIEGAREGLIIAESFNEKFLGQTLWSKFLAPVKKKLGLDLASLKGETGTFSLLPTPEEDPKVKKEIETQKKLTEIIDEGEEERKRIEAEAAARQKALDEQNAKYKLAGQKYMFESLIASAGQHSRAFFQMSKALAISNALLESKEAVVGAYAYGSRIGGPPVGAIFAGLAGAATAVQIGAISSQQFSGGRQMGGYVSPNRAYRVNESGPEMLSLGSQDYLMTGNQGGKVTPSGQGSRASMPINVNIYNSGPAITARTEQQPNNDGGVDLSVYISLIDQVTASGIRDGSSDTGQAMQDVFNISRQGVLN